MSSTLKELNPSRMSRSSNSVRAPHVRQRLRPNKESETKPPHKGEAAKKSVIAICEPPP
jgi:hypothetical protein